MRLFNGHTIKCVCAVGKRCVNTFRFNRRGELSLVSRLLTASAQFSINPRVASTEPVAGELIVYVGDVR